MSGWRTFWRGGSITACLLLLGAAVCAAPAQRAVIVSWDGAADWVVDRLLDEGKLPNVARLARMGVRAKHCVPAFPSKTACGHAAIWTGAYSDVNGISGNSVPILPRAEHTLLEQRSGFSSASLLAEPLFVTAAKAGKRVVVLSATQSYPPDPWVKALQDANVPSDRFVSFSGFESPIEAGKIWDGQNLRPAEGWTPLPPHNEAPREFSFTVGDTAFHALVYDDPSDPMAGMDTVLLRQGSKAAAEAVATATLKPAEAGENTRRWSPRFRVTRGDLFGYAYFRLFALAPDGTMTLYQRSVNGLRGAASRTETERYLEAYGGVYAAPFDSYESGALGPTLWQNGDGRAERRLLEAIRLDVEFLKRGTRYALRRWNPDLLFHYTPWSDSAGHTWMGVLDPGSPRYDRAVAGRLWPYYAQVFALQDAWLGEIIDAAGQGAVVCLVSDHGMEGVGKTFSPNAVLEKSGLLARATDGAIDLARTKIAAPPWGDYFVSVNGADWKNGIVAAQEREAVLRAATDALLAATDPETGRRVVTAVFRPGQVLDLGIGGAAGGDLYLDLAPGYVPTSQLLAQAVETRPSPIGTGMHGFFPLRQRMQAICYLGGAGVARGRQIPGIRQIDIAPTLARLLGIPAPKDARGHVLGDVFAF